MKISDVRVRLVSNASDRLKAVCSVTLDEEFVIRDVKLVEGTGGLFVAMPSRKLSAPCPQCRTQNHLRARFCNECGKQLPHVRIPSDDNGREKAHRDVAHPITASFRHSIQERVLEAYQMECGGDTEGDQASEDIKSDAVEQQPDSTGPDRTADSDVKTDDYSALIADLDSGRPQNRRPNSDASTTDQRSDQRPPRRRRREGGERHANEESRTSVEERPAEAGFAAPPLDREPEAREELPTGNVSAAEDRCSSNVNPKEKSGNIDPDMVAFGEGLEDLHDDSSVTAVRAEVEPAQPDVEDAQPDVEDAQPEKDACDDSSVFGAGIL